MRILILGGTGAMGGHLVNLLEQKGNNVFVTTRQSKKSTKNVEYIKGNAHDYDFLQKLLDSKWDIIIDFMVYDTLEFKNRINIILDSCSQYVFISSARVYADSPVIVETSQLLLSTSSDDVFLKTDEYSLTKARQEKILTNSNKKNWLIIRPYITYSESRLQLGVFEIQEWLYRALKGRTIVFSQEILDKRTTLTYGLDVSRAISELVGNFNVNGEIFHITAPFTTTWLTVLNTYIKTIKKRTGKAPNLLLVPHDKFLTIHSAKYQIIYDRYFNRKFDNSKMAKYITTDNFIGTEEGLTKCLETFLEKPVYKQINWKLEAKKDILSNEYTSLSEIKTFKQKVNYILYRFKII